MTVTLTASVMIAACRERLGNKWVEIAKCLPGRTENDVKNRAYCEMRKHKRKGAFLGWLDAWGCCNGGGRTLVVSPKHPPHQTPHHT